MEVKSLEDRRILIARPRAQAEYLMKQIETRAGRALLCPAIDIIELPRDPISLAATYNAIIFVSPTSVEMGWAKVMGLIEGSRNVLIAAAGRATADKIMAEGFEAFFAEGQGGAHALVKGLRDLLDLSNATVLVVNGEGGDGRLEQSLEREGAKVETYACYRRLDIRDISQLEGLDQLDAGLDAWIATSRRSIGNILAQFKGRETKLTAIPLFVNHSAIAHEALIRGVTTVFVCQDAGKAMIQSLEDWFMSLELKK